MSDDGHEPTEYRVMKSYVWHGEDCFFVSTIECTSSALMYCPPRYNETIVWAFDWGKNERGKWLHQDEDRRGSIQTHLRICSLYYEHGKIPEEQEA